VENRTPLYREHSHFSFIGLSIADSRNAQVTIILSDNGASEGPEIRLQRLEGFNMNEVALLNAEAGSSPSGTGSFNYFSNFKVAVENLAFSKQVDILGHDLSTGGWHFFPCNYNQSLPGNMEIWVAHVNASKIDQFVVEYQVSGSVYWTIIQAIITLWILRWLRGQTG
jgi:hypothetical protein